MNDDELKMLEDDIHVISKDIKYDGFCQVVNYKVRQKIFDGSWSDIYNRELILRPNAVAVLPYDPVMDKVVLIEQFRIGALNNYESSWLLEIVAGLIDDDSVSIEETARREMMEETGLEATQLLPMYKYFVSPGWASEKIFLYCAKINANSVNTFGGKKEENEYIKIQALSSQEAFNFLHSGKIVNATAILALQWLELNSKHMLLKFLKPIHCKKLRLIKIFYK